MPNEPPGPARLSASDLGHLRALGDLIRATPGRADRAQAREVALGVAVRYRAQGATWAGIALAIGYSERTIRRWQRANTAKPTVPRPPHRQTPQLTALPSRLGHAPTLPETISEASYQSESAFLSSSRSISTTAWSTSLGTLTPITLVRRVLVVSGDPRPGHNHFDPEAAMIRKLLGLAYVDVKEIACAELGEISALLDTYAPRVLHIAAHSSFGGLFLSRDGQPVSVAYEHLASCVSQCRLKPHLVVLNFCESLPLAHVLIPAVESAIGWPGAVEDDQSRTYAGQLYRWLAERASADVYRSVGEAHGLARKDVESAWPDLLVPELFGSTDLRIFSP